MNRPVESSQMSPEQVREKVLDLGQWFHNMDLRGIKTAPNHVLGDYPNCKWQQFSHAIPQDLHGKSVLDIGCNAGFYSIEMKRRGAERVVGIDTNEVYLAQARFAAEVCKLNIDLRQMSVYEVGRLKERFDIVLFMGVLYHLRYPLLALDIIHEHVTGDLLVFQSMLRGSGGTFPVEADYPFTNQEVFHRAGFPRLHFIENSYSGDPTNWWIPNRAGAEAMLRSAGFQIIDNPEPEVFICRSNHMGAKHDFVQRFEK